LPDTTGPRREVRRFGIGEWYGELFTGLSPEARRSRAALQRPGPLPDVPCPFLSRSGFNVRCNKKGGVCSLRLYVRDPTTGDVAVAPDDQGRLRTTCPNRLKEDGTIYRWVGETLIGDPNPTVLGEIGFLSRPANEDLVETGADVGRIDNVLVAAHGDRLDWCALEIQAVYFQGDEMGVEFRSLAQQTQAALPFPAGRRRLDYRSSGPKRLMPQLEIKVPSLRRWGKKMAVVVDEDFFSSLSRMDEVAHVSNCDIAWFVVRYVEEQGRAKLQPSRVALTTLERAVEGLTAGLPVSLPEFERRIRAKLAEAQR